jgi:Na+-transporting NADH:ubiquinone oxidoreductase subunit C
MKRGYLFTILFMFIVSAVFTALLATANLLASAKIDENRAFALRRSILYALNIQNDGSAAGINNAYAASVKEIPASGGTVMAATDAGGNIIAYAVPIKGPGLWGTIWGFLGISADLKSLTGIVFTAQSETPGLGARIDEESYKAQFRGMAVSPGATLILKNGGNGDVDGITGATFTSRSVVGMINKALQNDLQGLEGLK